MPITGRTPVGIQNITGVISRTSVQLDVRHRIINFQSYIIGQTKPKVHLIQHLADEIELFSVLFDLSTLRFERANKLFKDFAKIVKISSRFQNR